MAIIELLIFAIYRFFAFPLALGLFKILSFLLPEKLQHTIQDRQAKNFQALPSKPIWIHASSGEIEYAKSLIRSIKEKYPQSLILVTYFSPSAKKILEKMTGVDLFLPMPWDSKADIENFLNFYQPKCALFARTDVWPEVSFQLKNRGIPSCLFAATLAENSSRSRGLSRLINRFSLNNLSHIFVVSKEDLENFINLKVTSTLEVGGDTRYDQVLFRLQNPAPHKTFLRPLPKEKVFIAGSTWPEDETILLESLPELLKRNVRVVLAPHEISNQHLDEIFSKLRALKISFDRYTTASSWQAPVLVLDTIGNLQELYSWAHFAFVGGSFKDKVHSVMEPLCLGIPVLVGPYNGNNREALKFQNILLSPGIFAVNIIQNSRDLLALIDNLLAKKTPDDGLLKKINLEKNATAKVMTWIEKNL